MTNVSAEQIQKAVVEPAGGMGAGSIEQRTAETLKQRNADEALKIAAGRTVDKDSLQRAADENIGLRKANGTKDRPGGSAAEDRYVKSVTKQVLHENFDKKGFDSLTGEEKGNVVSEIKSAILTHPALRDYFIARGVAAEGEATAMANRFVKDAHFRNQVKTLVLERGGKTIEDKASATEIERARLAQEKIDLTAEKRKVISERNAAEKRLNEHNPLVEEPRQPTRSGKIFEEAQKLRSESSAKAAEIKKLQSEKKALEGDLEDYKIELKAAKLKSTGWNDPDLIKNGYPVPRNEAIVRKAISDTEADILTKDTAILSAQQEADLKARQAEGYEAEKTRLLQELQEKKTKLEVIEASLKTLDKDLTEKTLQSAKLKAEKEGAEKEYVKGLQDVFADAARDRVDALMASGATTASELKTAEAQTDKDDRGKRVDEHLATRYLDTNKKPDKAQIKNDFAELMKPAANITIDGERFFLNGAEQALIPVLARAGYTPSQIKEMMKDKAFVSEYSAKVAKEILTYKLYSGSLTKEEVVAISKSTWGADMIDKAVAGKADMQKAIDTAIGKGVIDWKGKVSEQLKHLDWKKWILILAAIAALLTVLGIHSAR